MRITTHQQLAGHFKAGTLRPVPFVGFLLRRWIIEALGGYIDPRLP